MLVEALGKVSPVNICWEKVRCIDCLAHMSQLYCKQTQHNSIAQNSWANVAVTVPAVGVEGGGGEDGGREGLRGRNGECEEWGG